MQNEAAYISFQTSVPTLIEGEPGSAKTAITNSIAKALNLWFEPLILSQMDAAEVGGWPHPIELESGTKVMTFLPTSWGQRIIDVGAGRLKVDGLLLPAMDGVVFADELTSCPMENQAAFLRIISERKSGEMYLPPITRMWAACNPPESAVNPHDLAPPMANRFAHFEWEVDSEAWCDGMKKGWKAPEFPTLPKDWDSYHLKARVEVAGYIRHFPLALQHIPKSEAHAATPWPSCRTWDYAAELLGAGRSVGASEVVLADLLTGCVGIGPCNQLLQWQSGIKLPDPNEILDNPEKFNFEKSGLTDDLLHAVLCEVAFAAASSGDQERRMKAWTFIHRTAEHVGMGIIPQAIQILGKKTDNSDLKRLSEDPVFKEFFEKTQHLVTQLRTGA